MRKDYDPIDPRVDIAFKRIFGTEGHTGVTKSFLNAIFKVSGLPPVRDLTIKNPFQYAEFRGEKDIELDILFIDEGGREVQLEMQMAYHGGLEQRMLHNWAQLYLRQIEKGGSYYEHRPIISLWVVEAPLWDDGEWLHVMRLSCEHTKRIFHDDLCIIAVELDAWRRLLFSRRGDTIASEGGEQAWIFFLAQGHTLSPERLVSVLPDPIFMEALELMADFNATKDRRHYYDMRRNYTHLVATYKETGYRQGRAEGLEVGREEGRQEGRQEAIRVAARKLLHEGVSPELVAKAFDLSLDEVVAMGNEE